MDMNANDGIAANREYKDRLFTFIFGKEENRPYLLQLYNALNGTSYTDHHASGCHLYPAEERYFVPAGLGAVPL